MDPIVNLLPHTRHTENDGRFYLGQVLRELFDAICIVDATACKGGTVDGNHLFCNVRERQVREQAFVRGEACDLLEIGRRRVGEECGRWWARWSVRGTAGGGGERA